MTTETTVMAILERANPVPPGELVDVPLGATRYLETALEQRSEPMTIVDPTPTRTGDQPPRRRWPLFAVAASLVAILVASIALFVATRDDAAVVDEPEPTVPDTLTPVPTTKAATDLDTAQVVVDEFFAAYNAGDTDAVLGLMTPDVVWTERYDTGQPDPDDDGLGIEDVELHFAWNHAQGEEWTEPTCDLADEQRPAGTTLACQWDTRDAVSQAVDGDPIPTNALIVVSGDAVAELHQGYGFPDFATLGRPFNQWMESNPPDVEGAGCCGGETREESERRGRLRAEWAGEWAVWLDAYGCEPGNLCTIPVEEWVAEYDGQCTALAPTDSLAGLVAHMRALPISATEGAARERLMRADQELLDDPTDERTAQLQQRRLDAMIELGIDERCHPVIE